MRAQQAALKGHTATKTYLEPVSRFHTMMLKCPSNSTKVAAMDVTMSSTIVPLYVWPLCQARAAYLCVAMLPVTGRTLPAD